MHYILYVALEGFYVRHAGVEGDRPTVVHHGDRVLDSCPLASTRGVVPGTLLGEAKTILREEACFLAYDGEVYLAHRDRWLDLCLAFSDRIEPGLPHEAYIDLTGHPFPARTADELIASLGEGRLVAGLAPAKWVAQATARTVDLRAVSLGLPVVEAVEDVSAFLAQIPTTLLIPVDPVHRERLCFLGYRWARDVAKATTAALRAQFGSDAFLIHETVHGRVLDPVVPGYPAESLSVSVDFGSPLDDRVALDNGFVQLAQRAAALLCENDKAAQGLVVRFESEEGERRLAKRPLAKPVQTATLITVALGALWTEARCTFPPVSATLHLTGLRPARRRQRALEGSGCRYERGTACESVVRTLQAAYGEEKISRADELKVPRRVRLMRAWKHATGWR